MEYMQEVAGVIYVTIPGTSVKQFARKDAAKARNYCATKLAQLGIANQKSEEVVLPIGCRLTERDGWLVLLATCTDENGKKRTKTFPIRKYGLEGATKEAVTWRCKMESKR